MKRLVRFVATAALGLLFVAVAAADTLELKDGRILQGRYLGGTQAVLRFDVRSGSCSRAGGSGAAGCGRRNRHDSRGPEHFSAHD